jgi:outer membrane protein insertion porin family
VGVSKLGESELRRTLRLPVQADSVRATLRRLGEVYYAHGYLDARLAVADSQGVLHVRVEEGQTTPLAHLFIRGADVLDEQTVRDILALKVGEVFRAPRVEQRVRELVEEYAKRGYLYATAVIERLEMRPEGAVLSVAVSEGPTATVTEVEVEGNSHSRAQLVQRLSGLKPSQPVDMRRIRESTQLLWRTGLFGAVQDPLIYRTGHGGEEVGVLLRVVESQRRNTVFGTVGLARDPSSNDSFLSGAVDLQLRNIYGTGRDLDVAWRRDARAGSNLSLGYRERFLFSWPLDVLVDLRQTVRDSTYTFQSGGGALVVPVSRTLSLEAGGGFDRSVFHVGRQGNSKRLRGRLGLLLQSLGSEFDGGHYGRLEVRAEWARKSNDLIVDGQGDRSKFSQTLWNGNFEVAARLARRHALATRGAWFVVISDEAEISESELYYFGGARTLRGYREDQFRGDQVAYGGMEYRFGTPRGAQLYTFVDVGGLRRKRSSGGVTEEVHAGYGFGLRGVVATGIFDLSFGVGEELTFAETKLHVSLLQRF